MSRVRGVVDVRRDTVEPALMPAEVDHYSIPALDAYGAAERVASGSIESHKTLLRGGEVLVSRLNPRKPRVHLVPPDLMVPAVASTEFVALRPISIEPRYLRYWLLCETVRQYLDARVRSATRSHQRVEPLEILNLEIPVSELEGQRRIADFLDDRVARIDQIIAARRAQRKQADELFFAQLENVVKRQESTRPLKGLLMDVTSGPRGWGDLVSDAGRPFVRIGNLRPLGVELNDEDLLRVQVPENAEAQRASLEPGDVLLSITAVFGEVAVWRSGDGAFSQHVARLRPQNARDAEWIAWVLQSRSLHDQYSLVAYGGTKVGMGLDQVRNLRVPDMNASKRNTMVNSLNRSWLRHESATAVLNALILQMSEYKQSLVTAAVAGGFDVAAASMRVLGE